MRFGWSPQHSSARIRGMAKIAAVVCVVIYIFIYLREPLAGSWNDILLYLFLVLAAGSTASLATMLCLHYEREETPRRMWRYFALGLWLWTAAELTYAFLDLTREEVTVGLPDIFWVAAYVFFAHAIFIQYRLLANPSPRELWQRIAIVTLSLLAVYIFLYRLLLSSVDVDSKWDAIVNSFYPVGDLFLALIAIWLLTHFQGGVFARPWLGLLAFAFTDVLYAWIDTSGMYDNANTVWTAVFDTGYLAAYLILALGLLSQWAFLKYGLRSATSEK